MTKRHNEGTASHRGVLWDLDGTLVESAPQHWQAWRETLRTFGIAITKEQFRETFGQRNDAILGRWFGPQLSAERMREIGDAKEERYRELVALDGLTPLPGATEWVRRLADQGWRQAIASSAPRRNVEVVVAALDLASYFGTLVAAEDVRLGKPEPEVFTVAARRLDTQPARCVVVEDAPAGIEAARRAGMASIGVGRDGFAPADVTVATLLELADDVFDRLVAF